MSFEMDFKGLKGVQKGLARLPENVAKKIVRRVNRQSAAILRDALRRNAPRGATGRLSKNVTVISRRQKPTYSASAVGYKKEGDRNSSKNAYYWRFVEFGTKYMRAQPFIHLTAFSQFNRIVRFQFAAIRSGIAAEVRKMRSAT